MRKLTSTLLSATLLIGGASMAVGQDQTGPQIFEQERTGSQGLGTGRFELRSNLRQQMRQEGFEDIRISDAMFVVQARTRDGRDVLMVVRPTGAGALSQDQQRESQRQQFGAQDQQREGQGQQFGALGQQREGQGQQFGDQDQQFGDQSQQQPVAQGAIRQDEYRLRVVPRGTDQARQQASQPGTDGQYSDGAQSSFIPGEQERMGEFTGSVSPGDQVSDARVRSQLQSRGFSNVRDLERDGNTYTATADWYGEEVDVRFNAETGEVLQPTRLEPSQVRRLLSQRGYSNIQNIETSGTTIRAQAERDGTTYDIEIDPQQARIEDRDQQQDG